MANKSGYQQISGFGSDKKDKYNNWRIQIFIRDEYTCQKCGDLGGKLQAHHIKPFATILKENKIITLDSAIQCAELWNLDNGITLCKKCHKQYRRKNMASENLQQKKAATIQKEADFAATNMSMQDRIKLDGKLGVLESKEKDPKPGNKKMIGPN